MELIAYQVKAPWPACPPIRCAMWSSPTRAHSGHRHRQDRHCRAGRRGLRGHPCRGAQLYGARVARAVTIQYGGSMNAKNADELLAQPDVDGGLIGGAASSPPISRRL